MSAKQETQAGNGFVRKFDSVGEVITEAQRRMASYHYTSALEVIYQAEASHPQFQTPENQDALLNFALNIDEERKKWCATQLQKINASVETYRIGDALYQFEELAHIGFPDIISSGRKQELEAQFDFPRRIKESNEITRVRIVSPVEQLHPNIAHPPPKISHLNRPDHPNSVDIYINPQ